MSEIELELPFPPSVNHYKKVGAIIKTKTGKLYQQRVNTNETKTFYYQVYIIAKQMVPASWKEMALCQKARFRFDVSLYPPNHYRYDVDNCLKTLLDGIVKAHVIYDDSQIHQLFIEKKEVVEKGIAKVKISVLN